MPTPSLSAFPINPALTAIAVAYDNEAMIADRVLPRTPVGKQLFKYKIFNLLDSFTVPNTQVGRKSQPTEVEFGAKDQTSQTQDYALDAIVNNEDIQNQEGLGLGFDPRGRTTELLTDLVMLDREIRVSNMVFGAANYGANNKVDQSVGHTQWSDVASDPIQDVALARDSMVMRPTKMVLGRQVATQLLKHPKIVAAAFPLGGNADTGGRVPLARLAELFELDEVIVGETWFNNARPGQAANLVRVWGKHAALLVVNRQVDTIGSINFGYTAQWGSRLAGELPEPKMGMRGSVRVRSGESLKELIVANDLGYLFQNVVA